MYTIVLAEVLASEAATLAPSRNGEAAAAVSCGRGAEGEGGRDADGGGSGGASVAGPEAAAKDGGVTLMVSPEYVSNARGLARARVWRCVRNQEASPP